MINRSASCVLLPGNKRSKKISKVINFIFVDTDFLSVEVSKENLIEPVYSYIAGHYYENVKHNTTK